jgi:hypothetical protein
VPTDEQIIKHLAEKVMGWTYCPPSKALGAGASWVNDDGEEVRPYDQWDPLRDNREGLADAFEALEKWRTSAKNQWYSIDGPTDDVRSYDVQIDIWNKGHFEAMGQALPRAICLALCRATGGPEEGRTG